LSAEQQLRAGFRRGFRDGSAKDANRVRDLAPAKALPALAEVLFCYRAHRAPRESEKKLPHTDADLLWPWPRRDRDDFLRGLWSYWSLVGIATRRVRKNAWSEKTTVILKHLWERRALFTERSFESPAGYRASYQAMWLPRAGLREMLALPQKQFGDDDAVNVFYRGQAFYDRTTMAISDHAVWEQVASWRIARRLRLPIAGMPGELLEFLHDEVGLDVQAMPYPGVYFNGYDDATIWIGCTFDDRITSELPVTDPVERVRILQEELVLPRSDQRLIEPVLRSTLHLALNPIPHRDVIALLTHALEFQQMPESLIADALRYLLFVQTLAIPVHGGLILRLIGERWPIVRDVFAAQTSRNVQVAQQALVGFMSLIRDPALAERILQELEDLLDPETILHLLANVETRPRGASVCDRLAHLLRKHPATQKDHLLKLEYLTTLHDTISGSLP